jgi:hypothetical protein
MHLCNKLHNTARLFDLALSVFAEVSCLDDDWDFWEATLAEDLAIAER